MARGNFGLDLAVGEHVDLSFCGEELHQMAVGDVVGHFLQSP